MNLEELFDDLCFDGQFCPLFARFCHVIFARKLTLVFMVEFCSYLIILVASSEQRAEFSSVSGVCCVWFLNFLTCATTVLVLFLVFFMSLYCCRID